MALTLEASGTQACTITTEHTLNSAAFTSSKTYVLGLDLNALASGDRLVVRIYQTLLTAGTERLHSLITYEHAQLEPIILSIPIPSDISCKFTLTQTHGTGRSIPWKVLSL